MASNCRVCAPATATWGKAVRAARTVTCVLAPALFIACSAGMFAQQPGKDKDKDKKPPALPAVNPATARLELTVSDLAGPAFDLAAGGENGNLLVAVACD